MSIKDIAKRAGVSHSTVSRALAASPLVNAETTARIRKIAQDAGYRASAVARSLVCGKTLTVGVVVTTIADPFNGGILSGIEEAALERGYSVVLANSRSDPDREVKVVELLEERRVDGIIVTSSNVGPRYRDLLAALHVPIVFVNNHQPGDFAHSVSIDDVRGARLAVTHLVELGHRRVAYIGDRFGQQTNEDRLAGYRASVGEAGVEEMAAYGDGAAEGGMHAMEQLLDRAVPPTGVFCYNDMTAVGAIRAIQARGLAVPRDISVVGFDDLELARYLSPPLTTVRQPMERMGRRAMEVVLDLAGARTVERSTRFQGELVVRQSTTRMVE